MGRVVPWLVGLLAQAAIGGEKAGPIAVVVGRDSPVARVTLDELREIFLRRRRVWPDGATVLPINLPADDAIRARFSVRVLARQPADLEPHWRRLSFDGIRPPVVLRSARAVCAYVAVEPAAIGYLPAADVDGTSCRSVLTLDDERP